MKTIVNLLTLPKAKLKIIYINKFQVDAIFQYKRTKSLLTWYNDYFIEFDLPNLITDEILEMIIDEIMDICADYQRYKLGG